MSELNIDICNNTKRNLKKLFKRNITEEEFTIIKMLSLKPMLKEFNKGFNKHIFGIIENLMNSNKKTVNKYALIEETINRFLHNKCVKCGGNYGGDYISGKIQEKFKCLNCRSEVALHERHMIVLWRIMDIINENVEEL